MKKLTFVAIAVLSAATTFAQSAGISTNSQASANGNNKSINSTTNSSTQASVKASEKTGAETGAGVTSESEVKGNKNFKNEMADKSQTAETEVKKQKENKFKLFQDKNEKTENHGQVVAEVAQDASITVLGQGNNAVENHGKAVSTIAHETSLNAKQKIDGSANYVSEKSVELSEMAEVTGRTSAELGLNNAHSFADASENVTSDIFGQGKEKKKKKSQEVKEVAQTTEATGQDEVKEVATAKRNNKPTEVNIDAEGKVQGAARTKSAARPQSGGSGVVKVAGATGASVTSRPVKVIKPVGASRPVKVTNTVKGVLKIK